MYASRNFKTKKELKEAVKNGEQISVYNPSGIFPAPTDGPCVVEGPHYPKPHTWYASVTLSNGIIIKVK